MSSDRGIGRLVWIAFFAIVFIGGTNFVVVKFSNAELPPLFGAGVRFSAAALVLLAIMGTKRISWPRGRALTGAALYGLLSFGMTYGLLYFALLGMSSGKASVIMAAVPLTTLVIAVATGQERFTMRGICGGLLALAGIGVLSLRSLGGAVPLLPLLAAIGAMAAASLGAVVVKSFPRSDPVTTNAVGMAAGGAALLGTSRLLGELWSAPQLPATWVALLWLVAIGSVTMFAMFVYVIKNWTASASVYVLTLMPLVAIALGAVLLGEPATAETVVGGGLVVLGVYMGALGSRRRPVPVPGVDSRPAAGQPEPAASR